MASKYHVLGFAIGMSFAFLFQSTKHVRSEPSQNESRYLSTEKLREEFSDSLRAKARNELQRIQEVVDKGPYKPTWESIGSHPVPAWFDDAKFGMFIDWGPFSVAGWDAPKEHSPLYPDWYLYSMYYKDKVCAYHARAWGSKFARDDFIPMFTASKYDPEKLVKVAKDAGMKYIVLLCKHHDGFCLWPSSYTFRNAVDMGPKGDLVRPLVDACRKSGLKFGFYFSLDEWEYPVIGDDGLIRIRLWSMPATKAVTEVPYVPADWAGKISGKVPVRNFYDGYIIPQATEFIDRYDPDFLWLDGEWNIAEDTRHTKQLIAYFYNHAEGRKTVLVNDRMGEGTRSHYGDVYSSEFHSIEEKGKTHKWEEIRGISQSYGYNREDTDKSVITSEQLIQMLADTVAHNGNLLLLVNLDGQGALPDIYARRLKTTGDWLKVNGSAVYGTHPWTTPAEGNVRLTQRSEAVYAISLGSPGEQIGLKGVQAAKGSKITLLGESEPLKWHQGSEGLTIKFPKEEKSCKYACAIRIPTK